MNEYQSIKELVNFLIGMQLFIGFAFIIQFIANIVIISQLPKIKRYERLLYLKAYGFEDDDDAEEENTDKKTNYNYKFVKNAEQKTEDNIDNEEEFNRLVESLNKDDIEKIIMWILLAIFFIILLLKFIL